MSNLLEPDQLTRQQIEEVERVSIRIVFQSLRDFLPEAVRIFKHSPDEVRDIAEDVTREALERLPGFPLPERIFGAMDFKRAGYVFCPDFSVRQALLVDSKAEKNDTSATLQISQTSLRVRQKRGGELVDKKPGLDPIYCLGNDRFLTTTIFVHYRYRKSEVPGEHNLLERVTIAALPNGLLEETYVPNACDTIWIAGRNAPSRGEPFRVRLSFSKLGQKTPWRVQRLNVGEDNAWVD